MQDPFNPLTDQERFTRDLITAYREQSILWDKNHPHYRNRSDRTEAHDILLEKCREYYPEADEDFVKMKIDSLRSSFRKEWNKVRFSKASAEKPEDIHKPSLWYYNLMLFVVGEECSDNNASADVTRLFWPREYSTMLIGLLKKHRCLYVTRPVPTLAKRNSAMKRITEEMNCYTGKQFTTDHIRKKIQLLKGQYRSECKKIKESRRNNHRKPYKSNLWCFGMLSFLRGHVFQKNKPLNSDHRTLLGIKDQNETATNSDIEEKQDIKEEVEMEDDTDTLELPDRNELVEETFFVSDDYDDIFDTIGKNVAHKLRDMADNQRKYAENLINEVMYRGLMEELTSTTTLSLDGT